MSILVGRDTRLLVQGITGREGMFHAQQMQDYGTNIVAGMTPGKGGQQVLGKPVPVFNTVAEAVAETGANTSVIYVPAPGAPDAVLEAVGAGIKTILCITEHIPALDMLARRACRRPGRRTARRAELPGGHLGRRGQGRHHPGQHPPAGARWRGEQVWNADLRGGRGAD